MALGFAANGTLLLTASQQDLFAQVATPKLYACLVHLEDMVASDIIEIRVFVHDQADNAERQYSITTYNNVQTSPSQLFDFVPSQKYRLSAVQTADGAGGKKTISWERVEVS